MLFTKAVKSGIYFYVDAPEKCYTSNSPFIGFIDMIAKMCDGRTYRLPRANSGIQFLLPLLPWIYCNTSRYWPLHGSSGVGWDMIKTIHKNKLKSRYQHIDIRTVQFVAIDEFSIKKGHEYMTIAVDIETGRVLHACEGRDQKAIRPFLKKLKKKGKLLKAIAMDMSPAFIGAVLDYLPEIDLVFDRYPIAALVNNALDELRRARQRVLEAEEKKPLKGSRYLLLSNYPQLHPERKARLDELLRVNEPLFIMHSMKENLLLFRDLPNKKQATAFLKIWCDEAMKSGIQQLMKLVRILAGYRPFLLNYFKHRISSGKTEGINNKIKTLNRQAYGFRDMEYFKLRLFHLHNQRYSLTG